MITSIDDLCFIDSETRRIPNATIEDVTQVGGYRYFEQSFATMWTWAVGDDPVDIMALNDGFDERLTWEIDAPDDLKRFHDRVLAGKAWYAAWNMAFDRGVWNGSESDFPEILPEHTIDVMAQAAAAGLPGKLKHASEWIGLTKKLEQGAHLIKLFEPPNGSTPQTNPVEWKDFCDYGLVDTDALRDCFRATRSLSRDEWEVYWASERINDRGIGLDTRFCAAASVLVDDNAAVMADKILAITGGDVTNVTQAKRIMEWADAPNRLGRRQEARQMFVEKQLVLDKDGRVKRPEKLSLSRDRIDLALAFYENQNDLTVEEEGLLEVLTLRQYGGSNTPKKFIKALNQSHEGSLKGQYVYNGAGQTGRFSSRGVQTHNLTRSHLGDLEAEAIDWIDSIKDERIERRLEAAS